MNVGPYTLIRELGRGGMGVVYLAQTHDGTQLALKTFSVPASSLDPEDLERFRREANTGASLDHPGLVRCVDAGVERGYPYLVMEFVDGEPLDQVLRRGPLDPLEAAEITRDLALALHHAHRAGILHRDIKPANVIRTPDGRVRLTDFGLARPLFDERRLTQSGAVLGTPGFMAPEQVEGRRDLDARVDLYALGALLYAMLTAQAPLHGSSVIHTLQLTLTHDPPPPSTHQPHISPALDALCLRCLDRDPDLRPANARDLALELDALLQTPAVTPPRRALMWVLGLALAVGVTGGWWITRPAPPVEVAAPTSPPDDPQPVEPPVEPPVELPVSVSARAEAERLLAQAQQSPDPLALLEAATRADPSWGEAYYVRALFEFTMANSTRDPGWLELALNSIDHALKAEDPYTAPEAHLLRGICLRSLAGNDPAQNGAAVDAFLAAGSLARSNESLGLFAQAAKLGQRWELGLELYEELERRGAATTWGFYFAKAGCLGGVGRPSDQLAAYRRGLELARASRDSNGVRICALRVGASLMVDAPAEARPYLEEAHALYGDQAEPLYRLAVVYEAVGEDARALECVSRIPASDLEVPGRRKWFPAAWALGVEILRRLGRHREAGRLEQRGRSEFPESEEFGE